MKTTINDPRLRDASIAELETTYLFLQWEEDAVFYRWERMLGLVWTPEDLEVLTQQDTKNKSLEELSKSADKHSAPSGILRYPMSLLIRPELLKSLQEHAIPSQGGLYGMAHVPGDALSLSKASKDEFLAKMGAQSASSPTDEFDKTDVDPFSPSRRPQGGFSEGKARPIGGGNRR